MKKLNQELKNEKSNFIVESQKFLQSLHVRKVP